jgi:hypothetical protein
VATATPSGDQEEVASGVPEGPSDLGTGHTQASPDQRSRRNQVTPGLDLAARRDSYSVLFAGRTECRALEARDKRAAVDLHNTLDDGGEDNHIPDEHGRALKELQDQYGVQFIVLSFLGITDRRLQSVEYEVDRFARKHSLDLRLVTVDHHPGQPFGRPDLENVRPDLPEETIERHTFSTGGKDWICYHVSAPVLFDDSYRNIDPARRIVICTFKVDNRST